MQDVIINRYSIKDLETLTGIKAHTLRVWEQRYNLISPHRTDTNIRYYDDDQLRLLLNVALLKRKGNRISKIAALDQQEIEQAVNQVLVDENEVDQDAFLHEMILSMTEMQKDRFRSVLDRCFERHDFMGCIQEVIFPFLNRVGGLWLSGGINPAQEHFASDLIRRKVMREIDDIEPRQTDAPKRFLLFLPDGELHELSLLISEFIIQGMGHETLYLGQSVPLMDLGLVLEKYTPHYLWTLVFTSKTAENMGGFLDELGSVAGDLPIYISGPGFLFQNVDYPGNVRYLPTIEASVEAIEALS